LKDLVRVGGEQKTLRGINRLSGIFFSKAEKFFFVGDKEGKKKERKIK